MARPSNPSRVYLDSCALITGLAKEAGYEPIQEVLRLATSGRLELAISVLTYVEVRGSGRNQPVDPAMEQTILETLDSPAFTLVEFHRGIGLRARSLAQMLKLTNYDAVHLASAIEAQADVLMTSDTGFPLRSSVHGVWIDEPYEPGEPALFPSPW